MVYHCLFEAAAGALKKRARDPRFLGGPIGMSGVLQTWTRDLRYHPPVPFLLPGGAISPKGCWRFSAKNFLLPAPALSTIFRAKFRDALKKAGLFSLAPAGVWKQDWVVDCRPAGQGASVLKYFAPYLYRVALSNRRLLSLENGQVRFQFRDGQSGQQKTASLSAPVFLSRFLQHVLPGGFVKVRSSRFLPPRNRKLFGTAGLAWGGSPSPGPAALQQNGPDPGPPLRSQTPGCPRCGQPMILVGTLLPAKRGPP